MGHVQKSQIVVDEEGGLRRVGGDREIYIELLDLFLENSSNQLEQLKEAVKNREAELLTRIAHNIKGAAANLGVIFVQQTALELEQVAGENQFEQAQQSLDKLVQEFKRVKQYLHKDVEQTS